MAIIYKFNSNGQEYNKYGSKPYYGTGTDTVVPFAGGVYFSAAHALDEKVDEDSSGEVDFVVSNDEINTNTYTTLVAGNYHVPAAYRPGTIVTAYAKSIITASSYGSSSGSNNFVFFADDQSAVTYFPIKLKTVAISYSMVNLRTHILPYTLCLAIIKLQPSPTHLFKMATAEDPLSAQIGGSSYVIGTLSTSGGINAATRRDYEAAMVYLDAVPLSTPPIAGLFAAAAEAWARLSAAVPDAGEAAGQRAVLAASETLLTTFDALTDQYERNLQVLMQT